MIDQEPVPTGTHRDKRLQFRTQSVGHGESRARVDTVALRLQRLGEILGTGDVTALIEWHRSQSEQLGMPEPRLPDQVSRIA